MSNRYQIGDIAVDPKLKRVFRNGRSVKLTKSTFRILLFLIEHADERFSVDEILDGIWGVEHEGGQSGVKNSIHELRKELGDGFIETFHGEGYAIGYPVTVLAASSTPAPVAIPPLVVQPGLSSVVSDRLPPQPHDLSPSELASVRTEVGSTRPQPTLETDAITTSMPSVPSNAGWRPGSAPLPPGLFVGRYDDIATLTNTVIGGASTDHHVRVVIRGLPGLGKTSLAARLAHDPTILQTMIDGSLWVSLGTAPDIERELQAWARTLGAPDAHRLTMAAAPGRLSALLSRERRLLIIDDVWHTADAIPFLAGGMKCATLITTRDTQVAYDLAGQAADVYPLPLLSPAESKELLRRLAPEVIVKHPKQTDALVAAIDGLPLALQVAGRFLNMERIKGRDTKKLFEHLLEQLSRSPGDHSGSQAFLDFRVPPDLLHVARTLNDLFQRSTDALSPEMRDYFKYLSDVSPKPAVLDMDDLADLWQIADRAELDNIVGEFVGRGLLERTPDGQYQIHSLILKHARSLLEG